MKNVFPYIFTNNIFKILAVELILAVDLKLLHTVVMKGPPLQLSTFKHGRNSVSSPLTKIYAI